MPTALRKNVIRNKFCELMEKTVLHKHFLPICMALAVLIQLLWIALMDTEPETETGY